MKDKQPIKIYYCFKKYPQAQESFFERFAKTANYLMQTMPLAIPYLSFGTASRVSSGMMGAGHEESQIGNRNGSLFANEVVRLRAIESSEGPLLEHSYNASGYPIETVYPDGICIRYNWDDGGQLIGVHLPGGNRITYEYREDGLVTTSIYPGNRRFSYEYTDDGKLLRCVYPDQKRVIYTYDRQGRLFDASYDNFKFVYEWDNRGMLKRVLFQCQDEVYELGLNTREFGFNLLSAQGGGTCQSTVASGLGLWRYLFEGCLFEMVLPNSERLCFHSDAANKKEILENYSGQTVYQYDKDNILASILYPNGTRSIYHRVQGSHNVYLVTPGGVSLYPYDNNGRLHKIRADNGQYSIFSYDHNGLVTKISTASGYSELQYNGASKLSKIRFSTEMSAELLYKTASHPVSISFNGLSSDICNNALLFCTAMWQWTALKSTLRLEDKTLREV